MRASASKVLSWHVRGSASSGIGSHPTSDCSDRRGCCACLPTAPVAAIAPHPSTLVQRVGLRNAVARVVEGGDIAVPIDAEEARKPRVNELGLILARLVEQCWCAARGSRTRAPRVQKVSSLVGVLVEREEAVGLNEQDRPRKIDGDARCAAPCTRLCGGQILETAHAEIRGRKPTHIQLCGGMARSCARQHHMKPRPDKALIKLS